jgi:two-component system sensor kinase FixL
MPNKLSTLDASHGQDILFQTLIATSVDGIMVINDQGLVQVYNGACERLFGYPPDEVLGRNVHMLMPAPYREEHDGYLSRYLKTGVKRIIGIGREVVGRRKNGSTFPMYLSVGEGRLRNERIFVGIVHDSSERATREDHIQELQKELLHATRLTATGQLAAALAHELNQPLTAILNYSSALGDMLDWRTVPNGTTIKEVLDKIGEQTDRAGQIIRRLRGFVEKREPNRANEDLNKLIEDAIALGLVGASNASIRVDTTLDRAVPRVFIDKIQIQQVMINLLRNAAEAMQDSTRRELTVVTALEDNYALVTVSDTGPGLAEEVLRRLFEPFVTTKQSGLGIGLSICRTIIEAHGGRLWTETNKAGGAVFRFRLPLANRG